jgi:hypothetical protein
MKRSTTVQITINWSAVLKITLVILEAILAAIEQKNNAK